MTSAFRETPVNRRAVIDIKRGFSLQQLKCSAVLALLSFLLVATPASATISYTVSLDHPEQHLFHVTMRVPVEGRKLTTALPVWNALYQIRDFAERLRDVTATCASLSSVPLTVRKIDKEDWEIFSPGPCAPGDHNTFVIGYSIFWNDPGPFDSQIDLHHAFLNLAEVLMYVPSRRSENVSLEFTNLASGWRTGTALVPANENNTYSAPSYDALVDGPIEAGTFEDFTFESEGAPIRVILSGREAGKGHLEGYLRQITAYELGLMGGAPFDSPTHTYTFLFHIEPNGDVGGGGMEHRNSSAIAASSAEEAAALAAHEFFHTWNVKRIRPQALEPVDYAHEQYTRSLWFAEGVTSAYASYTLERTGLWTREQFYKDLAGQIATLQGRPAHLWQSAEESSLDAWFEGLPEYADPARSISYYNKGQILGVLLDLAIRDATDNHKSFDDVMRRMNEEYAKQGKFYDESEGIRRVIDEVSGKNFKEFFARYVAGTDEIPYNDFLSFAGLTLNSEPQDNRGVRYSISETPHPSDRQRRIREGILRGTTD